MQLHLQNTGDTDLDVRVGLNLTYERDQSKIIPAGIFALGAMDFEIPANAPDHELEIANCQPNRAMNIFAVEPHMHKIGTKIETTVTRDGTTEPEPFYSIDPWVFGDQPIEKMTATIGVNDKFTTSCHYNNDTGAPVLYGESSDQEMCFFVLYYYPYDHIDGCITNLN